MLKGVALALAATVLIAATCEPVLGLDPRTGEAFVVQIYPPGGLSVKKSRVVDRPQANDPKALAMINDGKFTAWAQWYYHMGSDPKNFRLWWDNYWTDTQNWPQCETPVYRGTAAINQGHRIVAFLGRFYDLVQNDREIDPAVKQALMNDEWRRAVEQIVAGDVDRRGLLKHGEHEACMAQVFHFLRTKLGAMKLPVDRIYTLDRAQDLVCTLLTEPWIISAEDRYLDPPSRDYLENIGRQKGGIQSDIRLIKQGKVYYSGGLFIGWKDQPSLHGTWDALSIINTLFKYYPDPDPSSPKSIFYKWNRLPEAKKQLGKQAIVTLSRRLWLDWKQQNQPIWCWVRGGVAVADDMKPSEAPWMPAYDGYGDNQIAWAKACWDEMFGNPMRNTNDGVQALLAIAQGRIHRDLKTPTGQQVPGRFDFDPETQKKRLAEDEARLKLEPAKTADEDPKLDPAKSRGGTEN